VESEPPMAPRAVHQRCSTDPSLGVKLYPMSSTRRRFLSVAGSCLAAGVTGCSRLPDFRENRESAALGRRIANLERHIRELIVNLRVPGVSAAIIRDARIGWAKGFGVRDRSTGAPVNDDTIFSAQSMSKPVFAYRVMKLAEQGVLNLDAPLTQYTPDVFVPGEPRLKQITARRVLSHTTGLPNWRSKEDPLRINFTPGTKWSYSGEGYHYLQSVVTRLVGHTDETHCDRFELGYRVCASDFGEYMEANLLRPFGMNSSGYVLTAAMEKNVARRHDKGGMPMEQKPNTAADVARYGSAGSLMTTARDYAAFLIEVMQPKPADRYRLNEASRREMLKPHIDVPAPIKESWALGWQIWHLDQGDVVAHGGDDEGWHSLAMLSTVRKTGFVLLTNGENGATMIFNELLKPLLSDFIFA
jgi:CubicO group peptidase (beta-lactamase class C family)